MDKFREECGVFGIFGNTEASNLSYLGLYALQHRGQESAGIAASDGHVIRHHKAMGYVNEAFNTDSLAIPEYVPTVRVEGGVITATSVLYQEGEGLEYYIANAGGYARLADKGRVSVRYANGSARVKHHFLFFASKPTPGPGSTVLVQVKPEPPTQYRSVIAEVTSIITTAAMMLIVGLRL